MFLIWLAARSQWYVLLPGLHLFFSFINGHLDRYTFVIFKHYYWNQIKYVSSLRSGYVAEYYLSHIMDWDMGSRILYETSSITKHIVDNAGKRTWIMFKIVYEGNSLPTSHTHINGVLLLIYSVVTKNTYKFNSYSHNLIKQNVSQVWQFLYKESYSHSNPTCCPNTSDVIQGRGSE